MTPGQRRRRFLAAVRAQLRRRGREADEGVLRVLGTLAELGRELEQRLEEAPPEADVRWAETLLVDVDRQLERWRRRALGELEGALEQAWETGPEMISGPLAAAEIQVGRVLIPESLLAELKDYAADKISRIPEAARRRIEREISRGVLGGLSPHEVMKRVQVHVGQKDLKFIGFRAETITRTEIGRIHSMAADRRLQSAARVVTGLKKQWHWSGKSRVLHAQISGQIREVEERFRMPDGVELRYPRDPEAPVEHTANCGCESVPFMDAWK